MAPRESPRRLRRFRLGTMHARTFLILLLVLGLAATAIADDRAICAVCGPREGSGPEPVKGSATLDGKTYYFCSLECKVEFLRNPKAFLVTDAGKEAPAFSVKTFDGKPVRLADFKGKVVLLDFWATFCAPCIAALPELQALHAKYEKSGFAVVGLTVDDRTRLVEKATREAGVRYPILQATPAVWNGYRVNALPSLVLVGRDGRIVRRFGGEADRATMIAEIEKALR